jgi:hypothetical protein
MRAELFGKRRCGTELLTLSIASHLRHGGAFAMEYSRGFAKMNVKRQQPKRVPGGRGTKTAIQRHDLYRLANEQLKSAYAGGFYIECVSICESIIADRLESRLQFLRRETEQPTRISEIGKLLNQLGHIELPESLDLLATYEKIRVWSSARNEVIHQFVKITEKNQRLTPKGRARRAAKAARDGKSLMRQVSLLVRKHNKY